jgi:EmrB/QacA subfamily drug resistance transporter
VSAPPDHPHAELLLPEDPVVDARKRRWILVAMCTALVAVVASVSGLNVAQQGLAHDLGASQSQLLWIINGYTIALAALLLPIGAIGDRWGRKWVLMSGLVLFSVASLASSQATSVGMLMGFRIAAGVGAAMIMPVTLSVITSSFPPEERDNAVGVWAGFAGAGGILGLIVSSIIVDNFTWPWVFAMPVLMAVIALGIAAYAVPHSREHHEGRFDVLGSILSALAVGGLVLGIHEGPEAGWTSPVSLGGLVVGIAAVLTFVWWELRQDHPLLQIRVFRNRTLTAGSVNLLVVFGVMGGLFLVLVQFMQAVLGYSAIKASLSLLPMAAIMMPLSALAPRIASRVGLRRMLTGGTVLVAAGLALMALLADADGGYWSIIPGLFLLSIGIGSVMTPGTAAITGSLPVEEQGVASALNDTTREVGTTIGVALIGSILSAGYSSAVADTADRLPGQAAEAVREGIGGAVAVSQQMGAAGQDVLHSARVAFVDGWTNSMWVSVGLALAAAAFAFIWTPNRDEELAARAEALEAAGIEDDGALEPVVIEPA